MGMGDQGSGNGAPGIDVKITFGAINSFRPEYKQRHDYKLQQSRTHGVQEAFYF
jgi:hypothetical protein